MKEFKINLSKGEVLYTGSYICTISKTAASTPEPISLEAAAEKLAEELIMQQAMNREHQRQQDVTVIQFRQAQEEIKRLKYENDNFRRLLATFTDEEDDPFGVVKKALDGQFPAAWEGDAE
ncbi:hypothetical protein PVT72_12500 [Bacillus velezensis]|uniref:hypothetical protein n=1 Tax=Bacillus velezensis TaxID=492670 RepID=UPI00207939AC|nr:hypothetical protein [Bacillus velezensis]MEC1923677.1 hypothetical protein [Bacillus velezensis]USK18805.1 hypothetical protein LIT36_19635 [Bacillus velezensis]USK19475.1 hypothetical protein LIS75_12840 [Bacillus velezensis]WDV40987.1 hypothetical protein PVT72_12500 [Bacillus velezensis]